MNKSHKFISMTVIIFAVVLNGFLLSSCGSSQATLDSPATQDAAPELKTQTTATPIPTKTSTPIPASPTSTPEIPKDPDGLIVYMGMGNQSNPSSDAIYLVDPGMPAFTILLSSYPAGDIFPAWSSDGQSIAVTSARYGDNVDIFLLPVDGGEVIRLTDAPSFEFQLDWSPGDQRVVFVSTRDGNHELYMADRDGSNVERLTDDQGQDNDPAWSPDGNQIAFTSESTGT